ncbi:MAG: response regulator [Stenomitos rutilans HA7619-LM2]|jgi:two-component system sensor histidine kinase and response regulator WspE|nr:response regulator [Stenomitos rutilans HA7619-LM2]
MSAYSKLDLFRREVDTQVAILKQSLAMLKTQPSALAEIDRAVRSAHSLWGTARLVEQEAAAHLAHHMKECFAAAEQQTITLDDEHIDVLLHSGDLLLSLSRSPETEMDHWMTEHAWDLATTQKTMGLIAGLGNQRSAVSSQQSAEKSNGEDRRTEAITQEAAHDLLVDHVLNSDLNAASASTSTFAADANMDDSMMDLFRLEVEAQVAILNDGLLALESKEHSVQALETLMRAAHSIKGSARILALESVVKLAHVMEDCFVAAQQKTLVLNSDRVDVLLQGADLLQGISQLSHAEIPHWLAHQETAFSHTRSRLANILNPGAARSVVSSPPQPLASTSIAPAPESISTVSINQNGIAPADHLPSERSEAGAEPVPAQDRVVRVSAENLNRIMGLAGESLIEANWLQPHADSMMSLKWRLVNLSRTLEQLQDTLDRETFSQDSRDFLDQARQKEQECLGFLSDRLNELELYAQRTANLSDRLYREVITSHMRPFADGVQGFPRMIRDLARKLNKQVRLEISGKATPVDRDILKKLEAPLTHILRNATDHGIESTEERLAAAKPAEGTIRLEAFHRGGMLAITITDDGCGIHPEWLRQKVLSKKLATPEMVAQMKEAELLEFIFLPGFSTAKQVTEISGRGVGLDIAKSMAQDVGGTVRAVSQVGKGTSFYFQLPLTLSVVRTLLVELSGNPYAVPLARIDHVLTIVRSEISDVENRQYFTMNQQTIGLIPAYQVLELPEPTVQAEALSIVVISDQANAYGLVVDRFLGERDLVVRPLDPRLGKVPDISATSLLADGTPVLIVDVSDMVRSMDALLSNKTLAKVGVTPMKPNQDQRKKILVVDDSITIREMERRILENRGYKVDIAVNGADGWSAARTNHYDLVISDVDMPKMNGIELIRQMKGHARLQSVPIMIVSYRDREEDRLQGLEAGADYYLTKSSFQDDTFVEAVVDLIGQ